MFSPPLYQIRKYKLREIIDNEYNLNISYQQDKLHRINQQDNMLFRVIRNITGNADKYNPYVVFIDCAGFRKQTDILKHILKNGFYIRGRHFTVTEKSASMSRNAILGFIDTQIINEVNRYITMELEIKKTVVSKYLAYRGLMFSSCFCIEDWYPKIVIVDDYSKVIPNQHIKYVTDHEIEYEHKNTGEMKKWKEKVIVEGIKDIEITPFDGCGIHCPEITEEIRKRIGMKETPTSVMWRMPFVKGMTHEIDFKKYFKSKNISKIKDVWGIEYNIDDVDIIMTLSMYKGFKYFRKYNDIRDWQNYWDKFRKYNHCVGISKWNYSFEEEPLYKRVSYQVLQDLKLDYEDFFELADDSKEWAEKIIDGDELYTYAFLGLYADSHKASNEYMRAIVKNPHMLHDETVRGYLYSLLKKYIDEFKCGKLWIKGSHRILTPDLIMLMEYVAGVEPIGVLKSGEFYSKDINGLCLGEWLIERNPHICASEHTILKGASNPLLEEYCGHLSNICMINGYDLIDARLNGSDKDGDLVLVTNNKVMRKGVVRNLPVVMDTEDKITAPDDEFNIENITKSIILSMDNRIGEYSNVATGYHNKTPKTQEIKDKYLGYIDLVSILNGKEIDYSKCGIRFNLPKYIAKYAKPLPYFMKYAGVYYAGLHKFSKSRSNLNLLCWDLEKHFRQIKFKRKFKDFDYSIMIDASISWDSDKFDCLEKLYIDFSSNMRELQKQNSMTATHENYQNFFGDLNKEEIVNTKINWNYYYEQYIDKAKEICPDDKELANYVVEICYGKYPKKSKKFAWVVAKEGIISNIPYTKSRMPLENKKGRYSYLGKRYDLIEVDIKEDI